MTEPIKPNLEKMIEENLLLTREVYSQTKKIHRYMLVGQVLSVIKIVLIAGPIIVGIFFLQPYFKQIFGAYSELLGGGSGQSLLNGTGALKGILGNTDQDIISNYGKILESNGVNLKSR